MNMEIWKVIYPYMKYLIEDDMKNKKSTNAPAIVEFLKMII